MGGQWNFLCGKNTFVIAFTKDQIFAQQTKNHHLHDDFFSGAEGGIRTRDLYFTKVLLYH